MAIDHEAHKIRIKAVSDRMNHPMEYNDAGAPKMEMPHVGLAHSVKPGQDERNIGKPGAQYNRRQRHG